MPFLYQLFEKQAQQHAEKSALISGELHYSYGELLALAERWAQFLFTEQKQRPRVALLIEDPLCNIAVSLAVARLDGACIPTNPQMVPEQLLAGWQASDVTIVVYEQKFQQKIAACGGAMAFIACDALPPEGRVAELPASFPWSGERDFLITLSSGSTGAPKPIVISQQVKVARAQQSWDLYGLSAEDVVLCASPYFHSLGQRLVYVPLLLGATLVTLSQFTPRQWLALLAAHRVSFVIAVSSHLYALKAQLLQNAAQLGSLKTIVTSSAPIDAHFKEQLFHKVGCDFHEIYGATEVAIATNLAPSDAARKYATVGTPCNGVALRILDDAGKDRPANEIGEIAVKSPLAFEGYYRRAELTAASLRGDYFLTGDLGFIDEEGFLSYVSRKKDVIISGGINIYPGDIEKVLSQYAALREVAVIGVEDELLGEVVVAVCVTEGESESALRRIANQHLAPFQRPLKYFFVEKLPLTPSGKIAKQALRDHYNPMNDGWTDALKVMLYGDDL